MTTLARCCVCGFVIFIHWCNAVYAQVVNVLDLIQVTNSLGKSTPDPNGDGVVNILDLVFVARHFSQ